MTTQDEAHAEWHRNVGKPIGTCPCPWDACDPSEINEPFPADTAKPDGYVRCGNPRHARGAFGGADYFHASARDVEACYWLAGKMPDYILDDAADWVRAK